MYEIVIFDQADQPIEVRLGAETVWLTQAQMVELFGKAKQNISSHIRNIFKEGELEENSVVKESLTTTAYGKRYNTRYYNLDEIFSVGYRVKSQQGVRFCQWATRVLREHLTQGYGLNEHQLELSPDARPARGVPDYDEARRAPDALAEELRSRDETSELFARERGEGLATILGNIEQTMFGRLLYKTREERAAHLLSQTSFHSIQATGRHREARWQH